MHNLTLLTCIDKASDIRRLNKHIYTNEEGEIRIGSCDDRMPYHFFSQGIHVSDIYDFSDFVKTYSDYNHSCFIRAIADDEEIECTRRLKEIFHTNNSSILMLDVDGFSIPTGMTETDVDTIENYISKLPKQFKNVTYHYQFSQTAGLPITKGKLKVHLFFYLSKPVTGDFLKHWLKEVPSLDLSVFNHVQPNFISDPEIDTGVPCSVKQRHGLVRKKKDKVKVPKLRISVDKRIPTRTKKVERNGEIIEIESSIIDRLTEIGCVFKEHYETINLWHPNEKTRGGYYIRKSNIHWVFHPSESKPPVRVEDWVEKFWNEALYPANPPYFNKRYLPIEEATDRLHEFFNQFKNNPRDSILKAEPSMGKSVNAIKTLLSDDKRIVYLVPNFKLADELNKKIKKMRPELNGFVFHGRSQDNCIKCEYEVNKESVINIFPRHELSTYRHLCHQAESGKSCSNYLNCKYLEQYKRANDQKTNYIIMTHDYLTINENEDLVLEKPDFIIIDESCFDKFIAKEEISINQVKGELTRCKKIKASNSKASLLNVIMNCYNDSKLDLLDEVRKSNITVEDIESIINLGLPSCSVYPDHGSSQVQDRLRRFGKPKKLKYLYNIILDDLKNNHQKSLRINFIDDKIICVFKKPLARYQDVPILILDGDADKDVIERCFDRTFEFEEISVLPHESTHITQITSSTFSNSYLLNSGEASDSAETRIVIEKINRFISAKAKDKSYLIVCPQKIENLIEVPDNCSIEHFKNLRGRDEFKTKDGVIIIGWHYPPVPAIEEKAYALFPEQDIFRVDNLEDQYENRYYSVRDRDQSNKCSQYSCHPDPIVNKFLLLEREAETKQAIARIRYIHEQNKEVIILSKMVIDVPVDELISWDDLYSRTCADGNESGYLRINKFIRNTDWVSDVVPIFPEQVVKSSDVWESVDQFNNDLKLYREHNGEHWSNIAMRNNPDLNLYEMKVNGNKSWNLVASPFRASDTEDKLRKLVSDSVRLKKWQE